MWDNKYFKEPMLRKYDLIAREPFFLSLCIILCSLPIYINSNVKNTIYIIIFIISFTANKLSVFLMNKSYYLIKRINISHQYFDISIYITFILFVSILIFINTFIIEYLIL